MLEIEAFGDNVAQGILEWGGKADVVVTVDSKDTKASSLANVRQMIDGRISSFGTIPAPRVRRPT